MPTRSLRSSVIVWPDRAAVEAALWTWTEGARENRPELRGVGYFGSYARDEWGPGSDLDLVLIADDDSPFERRALRWDHRTPRPDRCPGLLARRVGCGDGARRPVRHNARAGSRLDDGTGVTRRRAHRAPVRPRAPPPGRLCWSRFEDPAEVIGPAFLEHREPGGVCGPGAGPGEEAGRPFRIAERSLEPWRLGPPDGPIDEKRVGAKHGAAQLVVTQELLRMASGVADCLRRM